LTRFNRIYREILRAGQRVGFPSNPRLFKVAIIEETVLLSQIMIDNEKRRKKKEFIYLF
jgi:hypothetical protein